MTATVQYQPEILTPPEFAALVEWQGLINLVPPHRVTNAAKRDRLARSLRRFGWSGPPLVGYRGPRAFELLTGSHRYGALIQLTREGELTPDVIVPVLDARYLVQRYAPPLVHTYDALVEQPDPWNAIYRLVERVTPAGVRRRLGLDR